MRFSSILLLATATFLVSAEAELKHRTRKAHKTITTTIYTCSGKGGVAHVQATAKAELDERGADIVTTTKSRTTKKKTTTTLTSTVTKTSYTAACQPASQSSSSSSTQTSSSSSSETSSTTSTQSTTQTIQPAQPTDFSCANPSTCYDFTLYNCGSGAGIDCACGFDVGGDATCFTSGPCDVSCNTDLDCGSGYFCLTESCCDGNICAPYDTCSDVVAGIKIPHVRHGNVFGNSTTGF